jgi:heat-inducible transcriptional repressor
MDNVPRIALREERKLSRRAFAVLCGVVELYIRTAAPVASKQVARSSKLGLSAATIRNVMARLENDGFLDRSHASAGCVPTDSSMRLYIDSLAQHRPPPNSVRQQLAEQMNIRKRELEEDIEWVAEVTAEFTREAGVAVRPMEEGPVLEAVSLTHLGERRVLGVIVTTDGTIEKRVLTHDSEASAEELQRQSNRINQRFRGMPVERIRALIDRPEPDHTGGTRDEVGHEVLDRLTGQLFNEVEGEFEVQVAGTDYLLQTADFAEAERMRSLVEIFHDRKRIVREWRRALERNRTQVIIGRESEITGSGDLGMVATLFYRRGRRAGALGVVGPRRMDYSRIVPVVEYIGDELTRLFEEGGAVHG